MGNSPEPPEPGPTDAEGLIALAAVMVLLVTVAILIKTFLA